MKVKVIDQVREGRDRSPKGSSLTAKLGWTWLVFSLVACLGGATAVHAGQGPSSKGLSPAPQMAGGNGGLAPDTTQGGIANSKQVPASLRGVGIDQRLNNQIPLNLVFRDSTGKAVRLGDYFGKKPVILSLVYFNCPMLCSMEENGLLNVLKLLKFTVGKQFNVVTVSFDPHDTPEMALDKKRTYLSFYGRPGAIDGWHFLTGDQAAIDALTQAVGFHYRYDPQTHLFAHAVAIVVITPEGKISRYFYGIEYPEGPLRLSLVQASNGDIGSPVDALILYCCEYNPVTGKYGLIISRVLMAAGILTVLLIGGVIILLLRGDKHRHVTV